MPGRLRIVDIDHDGFPDMIATVVNGDLSTSTYLYLNVAADNSTRTFELSDKISEVTDVAKAQTQLITFLDIDEDGRLDFLVQIIDQSIPKLKLVYNNMVSDSFFIKALMLNSKQEKSDNIYGDHTLGCTFRFVVTDLDD